ncbi:hypothetical protein BN946_scf184798.g101 [Trametes cinnabarina]|uniref:EF-hand domain-containing protein n=1 Tax=Pycnoporus cinnabarinus TaxID=5643 RepID=A0A060S999_PYCCI|nr:hypothetical protein BN946_scf184798.g101 [Trametes cinnabarina]
MSTRYGAPQRYPSQASQYRPSPVPPPRPVSTQYATQQQYYSQPGHAAAGGPPPGADPQLWQWFSAVDTDRSGAISVTELQAALVNGNWTKFAGLWKYIQDWQNVFRHFDRDRSGSIEGSELASALRSFGYNLSPSLLSLLEQKYASGPSDRYGPPPGITFDRFVRACVAVKTLTEAFQR